MSRWSDITRAPYAFANDHARFLFYRDQLSSLHYTPHEDFRCTVTLMSGLRGAGKDTWLARHRATLPVVALDAIRDTLDIDAMDNQGEVIQSAREKCRENLRARQNFAAWNIPLPGDDKELVYAPLGTPEADAYVDDLALGANFATLNHLLINALVLEAFQEIIPGVNGSLVYFISHNIARKELLPDGHGGFAGEGWVHRKGATRAFPAGHPSLKGTPFAGAPRGGEPC